MTMCTDANYINERLSAYNQISIVNITFAVFLVGSAYTQRK